MLRARQEIEGRVCVLWRIWVWKLWNMSDPCDSLIAFIRLGNVHHFICNKLYANIESQHITFILLWISFIDVIVGMLTVYWVKNLFAWFCVFLRVLRYENTIVPFGNSYLLLVSLCFANMGICSQIQTHTLNINCQMRHSAEVYWFASFVLWLC